MSSGITGILHATMYDRTRRDEGMQDRSNHRLNVLIEDHIRQWAGTVHGQSVRNMYENGTSYESICEFIGIDYEDYRED